MHSIFRFSEDSRAFTKNGFVRKQLLGEEEIAELKKLYATYFPAGTEKFFSSTFIEDVDLKKEINKKLCNILLPVIEKQFENYKVLGAQFLVKNPGDGGQMPYHQDWSVVDETNFRSLTVWISLQDIDETNGALRVVSGSQHVSRELRGPGNYDSLHDIQNILHSVSEALIMPAGEAFIFDHSVMHGSVSNTTQQPRMAVALGLVHKEAALNFYHKAGPSSFEQYEVADDFFITFQNNGKAPLDARLVREIPHHFEKMKPEFFKETMKDISNTNKLQPVASLFKDPELQKKFDEDGFVKVSLLNTDEAEALKAYYLSLKHDHIGNYGFHISLENKSSDYVQGVFTKLFGTVIPKLDPLLVDYKTFTASYVIKEAGLQNIVPPHQDWTFVDEDEFSSATVWIPLMNVNKNNGALSVIRGSHKIFNYPRTSPSPQAKSILSDHAFNLFPFVEVIEMKAGEALIFNNRTVHASPPNISGITRIAAGIGITQKNAQLRHYYQRPGAEENIDVYAVDETFFVNQNNSKLSAQYNKGESPQGLQKLSTFRKTTPILSKEEITKLVSSLEGVTFNTVLMNELAGLYNYNLDGTPKSSQQPGLKSNESMREKISVKEESTIQRQQLSQEAIVQKDSRTLFQKYTPANILAEIKHRLTR